MNFDLHPDIDQPLALAQESISDPIDEPSFFKLSITRVCDGLKVIANATLATSLSLIYIYSVNLISLACIGLLKDPVMLGGIGLGFACSNSCAYVLISSVNQGVNVLAAQAFGAKKDRLVGLSYHRGLFLLAIILIPILTILGLARPILAFFGIQENVAQYAWEYIMYAFPSYFFYGIFDCTKSYLYAQNIFKPILYTQTITTAFHFFWSWLFILKLGYGPAGAGIAKSIFELSNMIIILVYIYLSKCCSASWVPFIQIQWRREVLQWEGMKLFLITIVPIAALMFLDMACYEIFTILAGQFDQNQLSVHVALANTVTIYYSMPFGLSIAVMTYVANAMGRGLPNMAKNYTYLGLILNVCVTGAFMIVLLVLRQQWATLFSSSQEIKTLLLEILNIYFIFTLFDGIQVVLSGTLKGIGKQNAATIGLFVSYYIITLPLIYCLAFRLGLGVKGIWYGFLSGIFVLFLTYLAVLGTSNFKTQTKRIQESLIAR